MSSSPAISRPRPVSSLKRQNRRSTGTAPEEMGRSLTDAVRKISTASMPAMHTRAQESTPGPDSLSAVGSQGSDSDPSQKGSNPSLAPASASVTTVPQMPLSPVFSAVSTEPLQPQQLMTTGANKPLSSDVPAPPPNNATPPSSLTEYGQWGDKYAALADLDSAFHDPRMIPVTSIDWSAQEDCEHTSETDSQTEKPHQHPATTPTTHSPPKDSPLSQPSPSPPTNRPELNDVIHNDVTGDKYAALADLNSDAALTTAVDWGTSQSREQEPETTPETELQGSGVTRRGSSIEDLGGKAHRIGSGSATMSVPVGTSVNATRVISTSPPSRSNMAAQAQLYGSPPQSLVYGGRLTEASSLQQYFAPAHMYSPPPAPHHPGYLPPSQVSTAAGYGCYYQSSSQHGGQFSAVGFSWVPAYPAGVPQGFQGAGWGQGGGFMSAPSSLSSSSSSSSPSPSKPFAVAGGQLPCQASLCLSS